MDTLVQSSGDESYVVAVTERKRCTTFAGAKFLVACGVLIIEHMIESVSAAEKMRESKLCHEMLTDEF